MECVISQLTKQPFLSVALATGLVSFSPIVTVNGVIHVPGTSPTYTEIGSGLYTYNIVPDITGQWVVFIEEALQISFSVVSQTTLSILSDLSDEALGSWTWAKDTGLLTLIRQDSTILATFNVVDNLTTASRERTG